MTHPYVWHDSPICVTWLTHMCDMTHPYVWHDSPIRVTWLTHMCDMTHPYVWHDSPICVTWLTHMCDVTHLSYVTWLIHHIRHDLFVCVSRMCDMTHSYVWYDAFAREMSLFIYSWQYYRHWRPLAYVWHDAFMCDMTKSQHVTFDSFVCVIWLINMWHDSFIREVALFICSWQSYLHWWLCVTCVTWLNHMCDVTHPSFVWHDSFVCVIWLIYVTWLIPLGMAHSYVVDDMIDTFGR